MQLKRFGNRLAKRAGYKIERVNTESKDSRAQADAFDWRMKAAIFEKYQEFTMCRRRKYILNLKLASKFTPASGTIVECGTWRGGMIAGLAEVVGKDREFWLFDSFEGLPEIAEIDGERALAFKAVQGASGHPEANLRAEQAWSERAMSMAGAANSTFVPGWFEDTLPSYHGGPIALLRMDGDLYSSTMETLTNLYDHVAKDGLIIIDDYFSWDGCARAVHDFLSEQNTANRIKTFNNVVAYIRKQD